MIVETISPSCSLLLFFFFTIVNSNSPLKAWPCAVWQEIAAAWRQDATYHQGTRWLFNFTLPVAKTPVSVEHHNGSYAGGADVLVKGCKEGGGWVGRRTGERRNGGGSVCVYWGGWLHCRCVLYSEHSLTPCACPDKQRFCLSHVPKTAQINTGMVTVAFGHAYGL